ncbi:MAG: tRNA preQ1(34) S-adenosylmethionine ribosyltransferase-isomerase QueA [Bacillota bacterium]|nr:tRNA preQ1(34) S-adenosylmethionine ribosyltransferase-isomerase QueA [Bacillota bacterium]MDW7682483.1 tRNA preQ1(34) S-adenosylmethionine ribosyltransferase-isomerase QueA [Bacillota bacterium]
MRLDDFDYQLPEELIAQIPLANRAASRLLVLDRKSGKVAHKMFPDILSYLNPGDALVVNDTKVIPARLVGKKREGGALAEVLLLHRHSANQWEALVRPGRRLRVGAEIDFGDGELTAVITQEKEDGSRLVDFRYDGIFEEVLDRLGEMPLPPYIKARLEDKERYQTVYAREEGSAAAPTAGLHFTPQLLEQIKTLGVNVVTITLHVGLGTFRPVKVEDIRDHRMHSEYYRIDTESAQSLNHTRKEGHKIVAVGTTSCRVLETVTGDDGLVNPGSGWTDIFIYPGYQFKGVDSLLTNFHLPKSTLMMLISAFAGREIVLNAYQEAIKERYRFFSFGDAMLIL